VPGMTQGRGNPENRAENRWGQEEAEVMAREKQKAVVSPMKVPPSNVQAEQAILGGILINNDALNQVMDVLAPDDFYREAHQAWNCITVVSLLISSRSPRSLTRKRGSKTLAVWTTWHLLLKRCQRLQGLSTTRR